MKGDMVDAYSTPVIQTRGQSSGLPAKQLAIAAASRRATHQKQRRPAGRSPFNHTRTELPKPSQQRVLFGNSNTLRGRHTMFIGKFRRPASFSKRPMRASHSLLPMSVIDTDLGSPRTGQTRNQ